MKLTPWSRARATIRAAVASSVAPPNIMVPRQSGETFSPLRPKDRYSILPFPVSPCLCPPYTGRANLCPPIGFQAQPQCDRPKTSPTSLGVAVHQLRQHRHDECRRRPHRLDAAGGRAEKRWLDDKQFLSGYALSQLVPGATNVNLAVFIGTQLRGTPGAMACFVGL